MKAPTQIRPPENWQDFELLCKKLWGEIWLCPNTIKRNGRSGQKQNGVDVYGAPNGGLEYYGIQCKGKDTYNHALLRKDEIDAEIVKAKNFRPQLKSFYFTTTAVKDAQIEEYIREKNVENQCNGSFSIELFSWEDIVDLLKDNINTYNWYINDCKYNDNSDVNLYFDKKQLVLNVYPQYYYFSRHYKPPIIKIKPNNVSDFNSIIQPDTYDHSWCLIKVLVDNIGCTVIHDYMVSLTLESKIYFEIDDDNGNKAKNSPFIFKNAADRHEIFLDELSYKIDIRPSSCKLVQSDIHRFSFHVRPSADNQEIAINWILKSSNYSKNGKLTLISNFNYIKKFKQDPVNNYDNSDDKICIEPLIK